MPQTFVHCLTSSAWFAGTTVVSLVPSQICTRGHGPAYPVCAARTRSPHSAAVFVTPGLWHEYAPLTLVAQRYVMPSMIAPPAKRSGHVASITVVNAAPAENPMM